MRAGRLKHLVSIESLIEKKYKYGETKSIWSELAKVWAFVSPVSGKKYYDAFQFTSEITTEITIRYRDDVNTKMRIKHNNVLYDIKSVINANSDNTHLILMCKNLS